MLSAQPNYAHPSPDFLFMAFCVEVCHHHGQPIMPRTAHAVPTYAKLSNALLSLTTVAMPSPLMQLHAMLSQGHPDSDMPSPAMLF